MKQKLDLGLVRGHTGRLEILRTAVKLASCSSGRPGAAWGTPPVMAAKRVSCDPTGPANLTVSWIVTQGSCSLIWQLPSPPAPF
jgi:hypothetical protein